MTKNAAVKPAQAPLASATVGAQSVRRAFALLRAVAAAQEDGARLVDLASATGLARPTVYRVLKVLCEEAALEQDGQTRRYKIGTEVGLLGLARGGNVPLRAIAEPYLRRLSDELHDTVFLTVRQGLDSVGIDRKTGSHPIQVLATAVGVRRPLGVGVAGVAMLARLDDAEVEAICRDNVRRLATHRLSPSSLVARVAAARRLGYAWAPKGLVPNTRAVSVAIVGSDGEVLGAISVAAMSDRLSESRLPSVVATLREQAGAVAQRCADMSRARRR